MPSVIDIQDPIFLKETLAALRHRVRLNYERDMAAIDHVQHLLAQGDAGAHSVQMILRRGVGRSTAEEEESFPAFQETFSRKMTLIDAIEQIFRRYPTSAWTVETLEIELRQAGFKFQSKSPKASINTSLARLIYRKIIRVTKQGVGRNPSEYKNVDPSPNASEQKGGPTEANL